MLSLNLLFDVDEEEHAIKLIEENNYFDKIEEEDEEKKKRKDYHS
jgi:hypothetical protein